MNAAITNHIKRRTKLLPPPQSMESDEAFYELINGQWVAMPTMSIGAAKVAGRLLTHVSAYAASNRLGEAFLGMLIQVPVPEDEGRTGRPDVCFISIAKLTAASPDDPDANAWAIVPDLAIEVTSSTDRAEDQREKVQEYLQLGVRCVWVVYPKLRIVDVYESSGLVRTFGPDGVLPGDPVMPGLKVPLDDLFRPIGPTES